MKLTKIKHKDGETTITWLEQDGERLTVHKHEVVSREDPEPEFIHALSALAPHVLELLELPGTYAKPDNFVVQSVSIAYDKEDRGRVVVTCLRALHNADAPLVLNTPALQAQDLDDERPGLTEAFAEAIDRLRIRADRFARGKRAQQDLFAQEVAEQLEPQLT